MPILRRSLLLGAAAAPFGVSAALAARRTGVPDAPEVVEWHSLTCPFCAQFVMTVWPEVERRLVRPGFLAVRFEDFPLDMLALEGAAVLRALKGEAYVAGLKRVYEAQRFWIQMSRSQALTEIARLAGVSAIEARRRAEDAALLQEVAVERLRAQQEEGVNGTPAFKIGTQVLVGVLPFEAFEAATECAHGRPI
jgi:protein-disulfide isomerase